MIFFKDDLRMPFSIPIAFHALVRRASLLSIRCTFILVDKIKKMMGGRERTEAWLQGRLFPAFSALHGYRTKGLSNLKIVTGSSIEK